MQPVISVIMPIYNVEKYIANSIRSVCMQTLQNFEVILVDDGSSDHSVDIAINILQHTSIEYHLIQQDNKGVSVARNNGIALAKGAWIICIDADDCIHPCTFEILSKYMSTKTEVIAFGFKSISSAPKRFKKTLNIKHLVYAKADIAEQFLLRKCKLLVPAMLIKKDYIKRTNITYNKNIYFSEDQLYIWNLILNSNAICYIENILYFYLRRPGSTMTDSNIEKIMSGYSGFKQFDAWLKENDSCGIGQDVASMIFSRWIFGILHATSKYMPFDSFCSLADNVNATYHMEHLKCFTDKRIRLLVNIWKINKRIFWMISKFI